MTTTLKRLSIGFVDVEPGIISLKTTLTNAQIMVPGFLNTIFPNSDVIPVPSDFLFANASDGSELYTLKFESTGIISLITAGGTVSDGVNYNISQLNGNDATANGSLELQFKTINAALNYVKSTLGNNPSHAVNLNITDDQIYNESVDFTGTTNINFIGNYAQLVYTGIGNALTLQNGILITLARIDAASGNSMYLNGPGPVLADVLAITAGTIHAQGTGLLFIRAISILPTATAVAPAAVLYSCITRPNQNLDGTNIGGISALGASSDWSVTGTLTASGNRYPIATATNGYVVTQTSPGILDLMPSGGGGSGITWGGIVGTTQAADINNAYVVQNDSQTTITLPAIAPLGSIVIIKGLGAAGWILNANSGQTIQIGSTPTFVGGGITSQNQYDSIEVSCIVANTTWSMDWAVTSGFTINSPGP